MVPAFLAKSIIVWANSETLHGLHFLREEDTGKVASTGAHIASLDDQEREREVENIDLNAK